jgi:dTDP-4-dehydrorhamnose 3,5-epimerase
VNVIRTSLREVLILEPKVHADSRGFFLESFTQRVFETAIGYRVQFVQDNHSRSSRGVLRGLHFQRPPREQGKLVRVVAGKVFDVAVDVRRDSSTFAQWVGVELSAENFRQLWIPPGFAHGFLVLSETADFIYKATDYYSPEHEGSVRWDDSEIGIAWPALDGVPPSLSGRDAVAPCLRDAQLP